MIEMTGDPNVLILDGLTRFGGSPVSFRSRALRSGELGPSEWGTLRWTIQYLYLIFSWLSHGFMRDPPILVRKPDPGYELTHHTIAATFREHSFN